MHVASHIFRSVQHIHLCCKTVYSVKTYGSSWSDRGTEAAQIHHVFQLMLSFFSVQMILGFTLCQIWCTINTFCHPTLRFLHEKNIYICYHMWECIPYGAFPLTSFSDLTTGITSSALSHMAAGEREWRCIYFFRKPQEMDVNPTRSQAPHSKWCLHPSMYLRNVTSEKRLRRDRRKNKHGMIEERRKYAKGVCTRWVYTIF